MLVLLDALVLLAALAAGVEVHAVEARPSKAPHLSAASSVARKLQCARSP
jgi:hypothetical protein